MCLFEVFKGLWEVNEYCCNKSTFLYCVFPILNHTYQPMWSAVFFFRKPISNTDKFFFRKLLIWVYIEVYEYTLLTHEVEHWQVYSHYLNYFSVRGFISTAQIKWKCWRARVLKLKLDLWGLHITCGYPYWSAECSI